MRGYQAQIKKIVNSLIRGFIHNFDKDDKGQFHHPAWYIEMIKFLMKNEDLEK